jgi:branched-chain amino acid transport system substrate-binding protein
MLKKVFITIGVIAVIAIGVFVWLKCEEREKRDVIKIGFVFPLTGNSANHGNDIMRGAYMALEDFKKNIDTTKIKIEFIVEDNFSTTKGSVSAFEKLVQLHKPWIVLGPVASSDMLSMVPIAENNQTILFSPAASSPELSNAGKYIFRMALLAPEQTRIISRYAFDSLSAQEAGVLYMNDETGNSYMNSFVSDYTALGGKIIFKETFEKNDNDFMTHLLKIKATKIKVVFLSGVPKTVGLILKQAKELNMDVKFLSNYGSEGNDLLDIAKNAAEGFVYTSIPIDTDFIARYFEQYRTAPDIGVALGYDATNIALQLMGENPQDKETLRNALSHLEYSGVTGKTIILPSGDASKEVILKIVKDSKFVQLNN